MAHYSKITLAEANHILDLYDLPEQHGHASHITGMGRGISNSNYCVTLESGWKVLLKISNDKDFTALCDEQKIILTLQKLGFTYCVTPYVTRKGTPIYQFGHYCGGVFPFIEGEIIETSEQLCQQMGDVLAQMHLVSMGPDQSWREQLRPHNNVGYDLEDIYLDINNLHGFCPSDFHSRLEQLLPPAEQKHYYEAMTVIPRGIIHGDLYYDNVMSHNGRIVKLLDFEQAGVGPFLLDLGISISGSCLRNQQLCPKMIASFLQGYQGQRPLTQEEKQLLATSIIVGFLSIAWWRVKRFYTGAIDPSKKLSYLDLLEKAEHSLSAIRSLRMI